MVGSHFAWWSVISNKCMRFHIYYGECIKLRMQWFTCGGKLVDLHNSGVCDLEVRLLMKLFDNGVY